MTTTHDTLCRPLRYKGSGGHVVIPNDGDTGGFVFSNGGHRFAPVEHGPTVPKPQHS